MARNWDDRRSRKARLLLRPVIRAGMGGCWADIGCGDGVFTRLLLEWLAAESSVVAVDQDGGTLQRLTAQLSQPQRARVQTVQSDFANPDVVSTLGPFDGMLFANSLHFVRDKLAVLQQWVPQLRSQGMVIIIEYNANRGNWAVPHPLRDEACLEVMHAAGLHSTPHRSPRTFLIFG
ncbi:MAG: methyltransferase domain-containing protein [Caldilineaceae bacterium]